MKKILIGLALGIFLIGIGIGMISMVAGLFVGNFEMTSRGIVMTLLSVVLIAALPMVVDVIEEYFFK